MSLAKWRELTIRQRSGLDLGSSPYHCLEEQAVAQDQLVNLLDSGLEGSNKLVLDVFGAQEVVWRNASLTQVDHLCPNQAVYSLFHVRRAEQSYFFNEGKLIFSDLSMYTGLFPPSSRVTGVRCSLAAALTILPTGVLPVKKI